MHIRQTDETFPGSHRPLIPKSLFDRVQRVLEGKTNTKVQLHDFLFRRLITCKNCGHSVSGEIQKGHTYYRCQTRSCPTTCIREEQIEEAVMRILTPMQFSEDERAYIRQKVASLKEEWVKEQESAITTLNLRLSQIQDRMSRLTDSYIDRIIERDVFEERKTALLMERKDLEEKRDRMQREGHLIPGPTGRIPRTGRERLFKLQIDASVRKERIPESRNLEPASGRKKCVAYAIFSVWRGRKPVKKYK